MRHELLTQHALFVLDPWSRCKKGHAESAFRGACRTSSDHSVLSDPCLGKGSDTAMCVLPVLARVLVIGNKH